MNTVPRTHRAAFADAGEIILTEVRSERFIKLCDGLYPRLVSNSMERGAHSIGAFRALDGAFIGTISGPKVTSTRKNPWFEDDGSWFLRAWVGAMFAHGKSLPYGRCQGINYGALRSWFKLGCGAKPYGRHGSFMMVPLDAESEACIRAAMETAKPIYHEIRAQAEKRLSGVDRSVFELTLDGDKVPGSEVFRVDVSLL